MRQILTTVLLLTVLVGCKMDVTAEVYTSDIRAVAQDNANDVMSPTNIAVEIPSANKCEEYTAKIGEVLVGILDDYKATGCSKSGMDSYLNLVTKMPIIRKADVSKQNTLFHISLVSRSGHEETGVVIGLNRKQFELLNSRMKTKFRDTLDLADSKIELKLNNDERKAVPIRVQAVFVDSKPLQQKEIKLDRRDSVSIVLSNVGTALLATTGEHSPLLVKLEGKGG